MPDYSSQTNVAFGVRGVVHMPTYFRMGGTSLHPLQRDGSVPADSHAMLPVQRFQDTPGLGSGKHPAAWTPMHLPPVLPIAGGPNDPRFMV